jgi:hypothetical protein
MNIQIITGQFREAISSFLVPLQTTKALNRNAFLTLNRVVETLAQALKGSDCVSKSVLNELYVTIQVMRAEAPYVKGETAAIQEMAAKLEYCFALILRNESPSDRVPGVPRLI